MTVFQKIIPRGLDNHIAIDLITKHVRRQLSERRFAFRWTLARGCGDVDALPKSVTVLKQTSQLKVRLMTADNAMS